MRGFGDLEAVIMGALWRWAWARSATLRELVEDLRPGREIAYTTVMDNLHRKGCLTRERDVRAGACPVPAELFAARHVKEVMSGCAAR